MENVIARSLDPELVEGSEAASTTLRFARNDISLITMKLLGDTNYCISGSCFCETMRGNMKFIKTIQLFFHSQV